MTTKINTTTDKLLFEYEDEKIPIPILKLIKKYGHKIILYKLKDEYIKKYQHKFEEDEIWAMICINENLSEEFMEEFIDNLDWYYVSLYQRFSYNFIVKHRNKIIWKKFTRQHLSQGLIEIFPNEDYDWTYISRYYKLSKNFIIKFIHKLNWDVIVE